MPASAEDNQGSASTQESAAVAAGRTLREAREAAGISVTEVNARIHLTREVVAALETGELDQLGAPVFVRGHLRSYARFLKVPEQQILAACPDPGTEADEFKTHSAHTEFRPGFSIVNAVLLGALVLLLLIAFVYWIAGDEPEQVGELSVPAKAYVVSSTPRNSNNSARYFQQLSVSSLQA